MNDTNDHDSQSRDNEPGVEEANQAPIPEEVPGASAHNKQPEPAQPISKRRKALRGIGKTTKVLLLGIFALVSFILFLLVFFPATFVVNQVEQRVAILRDNGISIGHASFSLLSGAELEDILIPAPEGFSKPILTVKRVKLEYSPFALASNQVVIDQVLLDSPHVNLETVNGRTNLDAFLENLQKGQTPEAEPEPEPEKPEEPASPSDIQIVLQSFELNDFSAFVDDGNHVLDFGRLDIRISGMYSEKDSHFDGTISIEGSEYGQANVRLTQQTPVALSADLMVALMIKFKAEQVTNPKAELELDLHVATQKLESEWALDPIDIELNLKTKADMPGDMAQIEAMTLSFNKEQLINLSGKLDGLTVQREIQLVLQRLHLPLTAFAPYAKAFVPNVEFGGDVFVEDLQIQGDVPKLMNSGLPTAQGKIRITDVWAKLPDQQVSVSGVQTTLELSSRSDGGTPTLDPAAMRANGQIRVGKVTHPMATITDLALTLDGRADGLTLTNAQAELGLRVADISVTDPALGPLSLSLGLDVRAGGDLANGRYDLHELKLNVADTIKLGLSAHAELDAVSGSVTAHTAHLTLDPLELAKALALVPPEIRKTLPAMTVSGSVALDVKTGGAVPMPVSDPMILPVTLKSVLSLNDISVHLPDPAMALSVNGMEGKITLSGKPSNLLLDGELALARLLKSDQGLTVSDVTLPLHAEVTPKKATLNLKLSTTEVRHDQQAAKLEGILLALNLNAEGRLLAQQFDSISAELSLKTDSILYSKELAATVSDQRTTASISYDSATRQAAIALAFGFGKLNVPDQQLTVGDYNIAVDAIAHEINPFAQPEPLIQPTLAELAIQMDIGSVEKPGALQDPLRNSSLTLKGKMHNMRDIDLEPFTFRAPSIGAVLDVSGKVWGLMDKRMQMADFKTRWPEFDVQVFAGLDGKARTKLAKGLETLGKAGLNVRVRSLPDNFARVDGKLVANDFHLWTESNGQIEREDGSVEPTRTTLEVKDFDADVPMVQIINLQDMQLVSAQGNIFEEGSRGILYDTMRQYSKQQSNFHIDAITWTAREGEVEKSFNLDELALDMIYRDNTFAIDRMYLDLLSGGITGALQVQLAALPPEPFDIRVHFENQITGVNLGYLAATPDTQVTPETELSSLINMDFGLSTRHLEGRIDITRLSLKHLDKLLQFLDPAGKDPKVQKNRQLINAWYIKMVNPKVKLVSMWIKYGNLNMDIAMDAGILGPVLKGILDNSRIRRLNIVPILNAFLPGSKSDDEQKQLKNDNAAATQAAATP
jgi:hypothetical protein